MYFAINIQSSMIDLVKDSIMSWSTSNKSINEMWLLCILAAHVAAKLAHIWESNHLIKWT